MHWVLSLGSIGACNLAGGPITGVFLVLSRSWASALLCPLQSMRITGREVQAGRQHCVSPLPPKITRFRPELLLLLLVAGYWLLVAVAGC